MGLWGVEAEVDADAHFDRQSYRSKGSVTASFSFGRQQASGRLAMPAFSRRDAKTLEADIKLTPQTEVQESGPLAVPKHAC